MSTWLPTSQNSLPEISDACLRHGHKYFFHGANIAFFFKRGVALLGVGVALLPNMCRIGGEGDT